jgi:hypothetical protein
MQKLLKSIEKNENNSNSDVKMLFGEDAAAYDHL